jgi:predicted metal-dependent phosphoesterase TrpH
MTFKVDLHSHSTVSDGLDSPAALVEKMWRAGISALALTDHDTLAGLPEAREAARAGGLDLISGIEISADAPDGDDIHIVALFVDETNTVLATKLAERQENRKKRGEEMARRIVAAGYPIDLDAIRADVGDGVWGRPHIARALVAAGHAKSMDEAFEKFLHDKCPWWVMPTRWKAEDAVATIRSAGGLSSLAHAVWYKNPEGLAESLSDSGLDAIEVNHPDHGPAERERFAKLAKRFRLLETAGSDHHGVNEKGKDAGAVFGDRAMLEGLRERLERG